MHILDVGNSLTYKGDDTWATFTTLNSQLPNPYVTAVSLVDGNNVWLGTQQGAAQLNYAGSPFDKSDDSWTIFTNNNSGLAYDTIRDIAVDQVGNIWFGLTFEGVSVYSSGGAWINFTQSDGLAYDSLYAIFVDRSGNLWLGTDGSGVSVLDYAGTLNDKSDDIWRTYTGGQELLSGNIRAITEDEQNQVWLGTFGGGASVYSLLKAYVYLPVILNSVQ
jgi:ligand-binding sensor domain-containing protein